MEKVEYEAFQSVKIADLRKLLSLTTEVFSKIGTERSRQRLIYDLLNALKTDDRKRFLWLILKNINTLKPKDRSKANELTELLNTLYIEHETPENFEKIAYAIVMGIMTIEEVRGGGKDEE